MKSLASCLGTIIVLSILASGGYWLYRSVRPSVRPLILESAGTSPTLKLSNGTNFGLTVVLTGTRPERFDIAPGEAETRTLTAGEYHVAGRVSDPSTDPFTATWTFASGGTYDAAFSRDRETGTLLVVRPATP